MGKGLRVPGEQGSREAGHLSDTPIPRKRRLRSLATGPGAFTEQVFCPQFSIPGATVAPFYFFFYLFRTSSLAKDGPELNAIPLSAGITDLRHHSQPSGCSLFESQAAGSGPSAPGTTLHPTLETPAREGEVHFACLLIFYTQRSHNGDLGGTLGSAAGWKTGGGDPGLVASALLQ